MKDDKVEVVGEVIAGPRKMKLKSTGAGVSGVTIPAGMLDSLRVKIKRHKFLELKVVKDGVGPRARIYLVATTCAEGDQ